jgi:predicted nucleotidyltransferase
MEEELSRLFSRPVDFVLRNSVERSENYIRRRAILKDLMPLYVA